MKLLLLSLTVFIVMVQSSVFAQETTEQNQELREWTMEAMKEVFNFSFVNYDKRKEDAKRFFTKKGHHEFFKALEKSGTVEMVNDNMGGVGLKMECLPEIQKTEETNGTIKRWLKVPTVNEYWVGKLKVDYFMVSVSVVESKSKDGDVDFKLDQWIALPEDENKYTLCDEQSRNRAELVNLEKQKETEKHSYEHTIKRIDKRIKELEAILSNKELD